VTDVLLATCADWPDGEPDGDLLVSALAERGLAAAWAVWDDPAVDWSSARLVAVRSVWDYIGRREDFLAWAAHVERWSSLLNGSEVFRWNTDKSYLVDLALAGLPVVPTALLDDEADLAEVAEKLSGRVLVKPRVGAGGVGISVVEPVLPGLDVTAGPWVVQPVVESVRTEGEQSVFVLDGIPVSQVRKLPAEEEIRVNEHYGGVGRPVELAAEAAVLAVEAVSVAEDLVGAELPYARVDALRLDDGRLVVSELELTEPGLYLDLVPRNATKFARMVRDVLDRAES